jgi:ABC-2 type transport system permease protein
MSSVATISQNRGGVRRMLTLAHTLAAAEFKLRYLDAKLSYFWCVLRPLGLFAVLYLVFTHVGRFNRGVPHYGVYLLCSLVLWTFFAESTAMAVASLVRRGELVRKVAFPRMAVPLSVTMTSFLDLGMNLVALFAFMLITGVSPRVSWLELPLLLVPLTMLIAGTSMILSILFVRYRDVDQIWTVARQTLFYATPTLYVAAALPLVMRRVLAANPLAAIFTQARQALVDPQAPSAATSVGGPLWLLLPLSIVVVVFVVGLVGFRRYSERVAESL